MASRFSSYMSRNLLTCVLPVGLLAMGLYSGLSRNSPDDEEGRTGTLKVPGQSEKPDTSQSHLALPQGSPEKRNERVTFNPTVLGRSQAEKRDGPVPEEDEVYQLIDEALHSTEAEDRAFALSELGLLEPESDILLACFEALGDSEEDVRVEAALALEMLEEPAAIPLLRVVADRDPSQEVRETAAEAMEFLMNP